MEGLTKTQSTVSDTQIACVKSKKQSPSKTLHQKDENESNCLMGLIAAVTMVFLDVFSVAI